MSPGHPAFVPDERLDAASVNTEHTAVCMLKTPLSLPSLTLVMLLALSSLQNIKGEIMQKVIAFCAQHPVSLPARNLHFLFVLYALCARKFCYRLSLNW